MPIQRSIFLEIDSFLLSLVWAAERNRVKWEMLQMDRELGGLGLPDLELY